MTERPFTSDLRDGILHLTLDTPRSDVNIFSIEAATQLASLLSESAAQARVVVLRSRKPDSFINGVGLLLAGSVRLPGDAMRLTADVRAAYRALREVGVPTIAAVQGNCYGCGVELTLQADYRVAERSYATHFYMTEVADYLFIPTFGSTQDLPRIVGLQAATDLVLWGERWSADQALSRGLVDACFDPDDFETQLSAFIDDVVAGRRSPRRTPPPANDHEHVSVGTRARIKQLPPEYRGVYADCFKLLQLGARGVADTAAYSTEVAACGASLMRPIAKNALSFFFVREIAKARCSRGAGEMPRSVVIEDLPDLAADITGRRVRNLEIVEPSGAPDVLHFVPYRAPVAGAIRVALESLSAPVDSTAEIVAYAPLFRRGIDFFEIATRAPTPKASRAFALLTRAGFRAVVTRVDSQLSSNSLLEAYFAPLLAFVRAGGMPADVARTLQDFGFVRSPVQLAAALPGRADALVGVTPDAGLAKRSLREATLVSLLGFALTSLDTGNVDHPTLIDVMARELLDFPLGHGSLCRYLTAERARELLNRKASFDELLNPDVLDRAERYAHDGRSFYR
jgi:enoyl-CoA hydratase/carnithine racemase